MWRTALISAVVFIVMTYALNKVAPVSVKTALTA